MGVLGPEADDHDPLGAFRPPGPPGEAGELPLQRLDCGLEIQLQVMHRTGSDSQEGFGRYLPVAAAGQGCGIEVGGLQPSRPPPVQHLDDGDQVEAKQDKVVQVVAVEGRTAEAACAAAGGREIARSRRGGGRCPAA